MTDDEIRDYIEQYDQVINKAIEKRDALWALIRLRPLMPPDAFSNAVDQVMDSVVGEGAVEMGSVKEKFRERMVAKAEAEAAKE